MPTFTDYNLGDLQADPRLIYGLAGGLLQEMAASFGFTLPDSPTTKTFAGLIGTIAPHKELQRNIEHAEEVLGPNAPGKTSEWLHRSGVMNPVRGAFTDPAHIPLPGTIQTIVWPGGVANWMLRRRNLTERLDSSTVRRVILPMGNRQMGAGEHPLVASYQWRYAHAPSEASFAETYILPVLSRAGFDASVFRVDSSNGDAIYAALFAEYPDILRGSILTVGNAPNTIQAAGQLRAAARKQQPDFDSVEAQLYMVGDYFPVMPNKEADKGFFQNPLSGIGQIVRNALLLYKAAAG